MVCQTLLGEPPKDAVNLPKKPINPPGSGFWALILLTAYPLCLPGVTDVSQIKVMLSI